MSLNDLVYFTTFYEKKDQSDYKTEKPVEGSSTQKPKSITFSQFSLRLKLPSVLCQQRELPLFPSLQLNTLNI